MFAQAFILLAASLSAAVALPSPASPPSELAKRDGGKDWEGDKNGNVHIFFSDATVDIGNAPIDVLFGNLSNACSDEGQCATNAINIDGYLQVESGFNGEVDQITISVTPSGTYPSWIHNGLLDVLGAAVKAAAQCRTVTNEHTCVGYMTAACGDTTTTSQRCTVPAFWGINYQDPKAGTSGPPSIGAAIDVEKKDGSDGFCSTFTTIGSAVAGAVNGAAGGAFSLLSLVCDDKA